MIITDESKPALVALYEVMVAHNIYFHVSYLGEICVHVDCGAPSIIGSYDGELGSEDIILALVGPFHREDV